MAKYIGAGDSLECLKSNVATRKISNNPYIIEIEGIKYFKYSTKIRCTIKIIEELNPKIHRISEFSALNIHDELEAEGIDIYTEKRISLKIISNYSNVHSIQSNDINSFTYAKILIPFRFVLQKTLASGQRNCLNI
jgi:hypothetical protein